MTPETTRAIDQALGELPLIDRITALMCSVITRKPEATKGVVSMIAIVTAMAKYLDAPERVAAAEILRDAADAVERRQLERV
jgi:hypothetical protein